MHLQSIFAKYVFECHREDSETIKFEVNIVEAFKRQFERQILEGVEIDNEQQNLTTTNQQWAGLVLQMRSRMTRMYTTG